MSLTYTLVADPPPPSRDRGGRRVVGVVGEVLITVGVVLLLFCGYSLWWTNVTADRAAAHERDRIVEQWQRGRGAGLPAGAGSPTRGGAPGGGATAIRPSAGEGFALLRIPRLGDGFEVPVVEGVDKADLAKGVGHYPGTALPGQVGNVGIAGHRATHGEPFRNLDRLRVGDLVGIETALATYEYRVYGSAIVRPSAGEVIAPVPNRPGVAPTQRLLTLTTCHPRWSSAKRLVFWAQLVRATPKPTPPATGGR